MSPISLGIIASTLAGLATGVGALPALFFKNVPDRILNTLLGGAAGVIAELFRTGSVAAF